MIRCDECDKPLDRASDDSHAVHERWCEVDDICTCDLYVHAGCCPDPCCRAIPVIPGQLDLLAAS